MTGITYFLKMCWRFNKKYIILLGINQIVKVGTSLITLFLPQAILDAIFTDHNVNNAIRYICIFLGLSLCFNVTGQLITCISNNERTKTFNLFQVDLAMRMMSTKLEKLESQTFLSLKAKAEQYLYGGGQGFGSTLESSFDIFGMIVTLTMYSVVISQLHPLILIALAIIIAVNVRLNYYYQKKNIEVNLEKAAQERKSAYYGTVFQSFEYGKEIRVNDLREWMIKKYDDQLNKMQFFYKSLNGNNFKYSLFSLLIMVVQQAVSYGYLLIQTVQNTISVGVFSLYLNAIVSFSSTAKMVINQIVLIRQYTMYYDSYKQYVGSENIFEDGNEKFQYKSDQDMVIEFKDVSFKYPFNSFFSLKNINATIHKGDKIALVGKNGAGKSTFIKLLLRIYKPTCGTITFNGQDINEISYTDYIRLFSCVFQDYKLFAQSILENITFDENSASVEEVYAILKDINMDDKIRGFPNTLHTTIYKTFDDDGYIPSEGEAQKIAFARAIYKDSPIVILDEPSSSLDPQSEFDVYRIFDGMTKAKTCLYISHRLAISAFSNKILVFDDGEITECGQHDELMKKGGLYHSMYSMQTKYYNKTYESKIP